MVLKKEIITDRLKGLDPREVFKKFKIGPEIFPRLNK